MSTNNQQSQVKNEFQLLDELEDAIKSSKKWAWEVSCPTYLPVQELRYNINQAQNIVTQLKSLLIQKSRKVE